MTGDRQGGSFDTRRLDWQTPRALFEQLHAEFGFTLDAAASAENALLPTFLTEADDALSRVWRGTVFCNPPYGQFELPKWVAKAREEAASGRALVVMLLPARTSSAWFHDYCGVAEMRFIRGRLRFHGAKSTAPFGSVIVIFRPGIPRA